MPSQVCKLERMKVAFFPPVCHFPHVAASQHYASVQEGRVFFLMHACGLRSSPEYQPCSGLPPSSCSRRANPQPRDALIETCCQSDKHICIQSTLYLFSLERSTVCCWLNILNQFAVSELPASSLVPAASSLGDRLAAGGDGPAKPQTLSFNSFQLWPRAGLSFSPSPGAGFDGPLTVTGSVSRAPATGRREF